jgi:hypothetical protein
MDVNFEPGLSSQIVRSLILNDESSSFKDKKYPLLAMLMPVREKRGLGVYALIKIDRIIIATLTKSGDNTESVKDRYKTGGTFKDILYPCYYEFLDKLAWSGFIAESDPNALKHDKLDVPGAGGKGIDFIDSIEILNLEFNLVTQKICK